MNILEIADMLQSIDEEQIDEKMNNFADIVVEKIHQKMKVEIAELYCAIDEACDK